MWEILNIEYFWSIDLIQFFKIQIWMKIEFQIYVQDVRIPFSLSKFIELNQQHKQNKLNIKMINIFVSIN
jgi:hypothetical protein